MRSKHSYSYFFFFFFQLRETSCNWTCGYKGLMLPWYELKGSLHFLKCIALFMMSIIQWIFIISYFCFADVLAEQIIDAYPSGYSVMVKMIVVITLMNRLKIAPNAMRVETSSVKTDVAFQSKWSNKHCMLKYSKCKNRCYILQ